MVRASSNGTGWTVKDVYDFFPGLAGLKDSSRRPAFGRRAPDAGDRTRHASRDRRC